MPKQGNLSLKFKSRSSSIILCDHPVLAYIICFSSSVSLCKFSIRAGHKQVSDKPAPGKDPTAVAGKPTATSSAGKGASKPAPGKYSTAEIGKPTAPSSPGKDAGNPSSGKDATAGASKPSAFGNISEISSKFFGMPPAEKNEAGKKFIQIN